MLTTRINANNQRETTRSVIQIVTIRQTEMKLTYSLANKSMILVIIPSLKAYFELLSLSAQIMSELPDTPSLRLRPGYLGVRPWSASLSKSACGNYVTKQSRLSLSTLSKPCQPQMPAIMLLFAKTISKLLQLY